VLFSSVAADSEGLFSANGSSYGPELTRRERYVALAAASGMSNQQIARKASVSVRTVEGHLYQVYSKLGINKRTQLSNLVSAGQHTLSEEFDKA
jgi:DNA-binding CsgD family transcriptional regulator